MSPLNQRNKAGKTSLYVAASIGHAPTVKLLLGAGAKVDVADHHGLSPLHAACEDCHTDVVRLLLDAGAKVNLRSVRGMTPLLRACYNGNADVVRLLLNKGAQVNMRGEGGIAPLAAAVFGGHIEVVHMLLDRGACVDHPEAAYGSMPLHVTVRAVGDSHTDSDDNFVAVARALLKKGAPINAVDKAGSTALHDACHTGCSVEMLQVLLVAGADPDALDGAGQKPDGLAVLMKTMCSVCWAVGKMKVCPCRASRYCSTECQRVHWNRGHCERHGRPLPSPMTPQNLPQD